MGLENSNSGRPFKWGLLIVALVAVGGGIYYYLERGRDAPEQRPQPQSTEWTTKPTNGVPVDLPDTPMTNVPTKPSPSEGAEEQAENAEGSGSPADNP